MARSMSEVMIAMLYALNPDGSLKWSYQTGGEVYSSPAIGADGTVYVGSCDGKVYALNPDGSLKWSYTTGDSVYSSPAIGADGTVYVGSGDGKVYAFNKTGPVTSAWPDFRIRIGFTTAQSPYVGAQTIT